MIKISLYRHGDEPENVVDIPFKVTQYPAGEIGVVVDVQDHLILADDYGQREFFIYLRFEAIGELFLVGLIKDALLRSLKYNKQYGINFSIPYFPFGRQDRVTQPGEAFSLKVVADYINSLDFDRVFITDPHSHVTPALINNCIVDDTVNIRKQHMFLIDNNISFLISPDMGANKKTHEMGNTYGLPVVEFTKHRDPVTGMLSGFKIMNPDIIPDLPVGDGLVVDDICDGGGTFMGIAEKFKEYDPEIDLHLYITFGFFTRGIETLLSHYKTVGYTYDMRTEK